MSNTKNTVPEPGRVRYSIVRRLNSRLFFRLLGIFISLDVMICILAGGILAVYSEQKADAAARSLKSEALPYAQEAAPPGLSGVTALTVDEAPAGISVMRPFSFLLPDATADSVRRLEAEGGAADESFLNRLGGVTYAVYYNSGLYLYRISVGLGPFLHYFRYGMEALFLYELLVLLSRLTKDRKMVRETLEPIAKLSEAAESLNQAGSRFDPNKMAALAGRLEGINAARLDTRLPVDDAQEELKDLSSAINGMLERINEAYRAQVRFVSDASHELRTPIAVIQGYANLLDRWGKNDEKTLQESIGAIKDEAANMKELVEQLLFLARGDNNTIALQLEDIALQDLAGEVLSETRMIDSTHRFEARFGDAHVTADRALVKQALRILVDNAMKYTDAGGAITVATERTDGWARLSVTDDGIGIRPEAVPQIFDRFYRADESRTRATGGAGLGLSIAKWIAERHGGHMEVLSRVGIGTKITVALPGSAAAPKQAEEGSKQ